jgi:hypothetical protein
MRFWPIPAIRMTRPATASEAARALALKGHKLRRDEIAAQRTAKLNQLRGEVAAGIVAPLRTIRGEWA